MRPLNVLGLLLLAESALAAEPPANPQAGRPEIRLAEPGSPASQGRFEFGSYGRVNVASDLRGGTGRPSNIVSHGPRIDEESYTEFELRREDDWSSGFHTRVVTSLALFAPFFHFSGSVDQRIGVRNLYAQANAKNWSLWAGSRMYRGDDIYLLNWWPLDNQNTMGAGGTYRIDHGQSDTTLALHAGMQRLDDGFQMQQIQSPIPFGVTSTNVTVLDRPRTIETFKVTHQVRGNAGRPIFGSDTGGLKFIGYAEAHQLPAGAFRDTTIQQDKPLPSDWGVLVGGQVTFYTGKRDTYASLFVRHARGVAAYDPLAVPPTFAFDRTTAGAAETQVALATNVELGPVTLPLAAYLRWFRDASPTETSLYKYDEGAIVARPHLFFTDHWGIALEGSYQLRRHAFLDVTRGGPLTASIIKGGVIPFFSPAGRGTFKRPQFRLIYNVTARSDGARSLYPQDDVFASRRVEHFLGVGAEWWFNFSSYP